MIKAVGQAVSVVKSLWQTPRLVDSTEPLHEEPRSKYETANEQLLQMPQQSLCKFCRHGDTDKADQLDEQSMADPTRICCIFQFDHSEPQLAPCAAKGTP
jgi:hypothetical protein